MKTKAEWLFEDVQAVRRFGKVHCNSYQRDKYKNCASEDLIKLVDEFIYSIGYTPIGEAWKTLDRNEAFTIINNILKMDLAYKFQFISNDLSEFISQKFLSIFSTSAKFYTNGEIGLKQEFSGEWMPISGATFDTGVIVIDETQIGILWVEDED